MGFIRPHRPDYLTNPQRSRRLRAGRLRRTFRELCDTAARPGETVASFNHPGGNATGVTFLTATLDAKRLGLLRELLPQATVIASLLDANYPASASQLKGLHDAAVALGLQLHVLEASNESQLDQAFVTLTNLRPDALVVSASAFVGAHRQQIIELAARSSLPAMYPNPDFPLAGGLISYGANVPDSFRQAGVIPAAS
jgi:putative tryptophan/tyrosine transport system substrate-binding protein